MVIYKSSKYCCCCFVLLGKIDINTAMSFEILTLCAIELHVILLLWNGGTGFRTAKRPTAPIQSISVAIRKQTIPQVLVPRSARWHQWNHQQARSLHSGPKGDANSGACTTSHFLFLFYWKATETEGSG